MGATEHRFHSTGTPRRCAGGPGMSAVGRCAVSRGRVAFVADEVDCGDQRADGTNAGGSTRFGPAEVVGKRAGGSLPGALVGGFGRDEVERGSVAVSVVTAFAGGGDAKPVGAQEPERVVEQACIDWL